MERNEKEKEREKRTKRPVIRKMVANSTTFALCFRDPGKRETRLVKLINHSVEEKGS